MPDELQEFSGRSRALGTSIKEASLCWNEISIGREEVNWWGGEGRRHLTWAQLSLPVEEMLVPMDEEFIPVPAADYGDIKVHARVPATAVTISSITAAKSKYPGQDEGDQEDVGGLEDEGELEDVGELEVEGELEDNGGVEDEGELEDDGGVEDGGEEIVELEDPVSDDEMSFNLTKIKMNS